MSARPQGSGASEHHLFGKPLDPSLLAEPVAAASRPFPKRAFASIALPFAALAGAALLQKLLGPEQAGDLLLRWLCWSAALGALLGLLAGLMLVRTFGGRAFWTLFGAAAPLAIAALVVGGSKAVLPLREAVAARGEARCRVSRQVCRPEEFRTACTEASHARQARAQLQPKLGPPAQELCSADGCTYRWLYTGPWRPNEWVAPGSILCSLVVDSSGKALRVALGPGVDPN